MLLRRLQLINYGGIYNGMGLYEIDIDFTKCKHRLILIKGDNGTGKSTIENSLKPLPDDNSSFIQGMNASKIIEYYDEYTNIIYSIQFLHECKPNGTRGNAKGYIKKYILGTNDITELNPSGNITSCKNIIFEELQLDPNYIALTQLSNTKRGIADLRPADRKKFVNSILNNTDVYNDMHKTLSKKSTSYKSLMNSMISKLDNIGDITQLNISLKNMNETIDKIENQISNFIEIKAREEGMLKTIDPNHSLADKIEVMNTELDKYRSKKNEIEKKRHEIFLKNKNLNHEYDASEVEDLEELKIKVSNIISSLKSKITSLLESRQLESEELRVKSSKLQTLNSNESLEEVKRMKEELRNKKSNIENRWGGYIVDITNISKEELLSCIKVIKHIYSQIQTINLSTIRNGDKKYYKNKVMTFTSNIIDIDNEIKILRKQYEESLIKESKISILAKRPSTCKIDTCPFVKDAIDILDTKFESSSNINTKIKELELNRLNLSEEIKYIENDVYNMFCDYENIKNTFNIYYDTFMKFNLGFKNFNELLELLYNIETYNQIINTLQYLMEYSNDLEEYKVIDKSILEIESRFDKLSSQEEFINLLISDITRLQSQLDTDTKKINDMNIEIKSYETKYINLCYKIDIISSIIEYNNIVSSCNEAIGILTEEIENNKSEIDKIQKINSDISKLTTAIESLSKELTPLKNNRDSIKFKIEMSKEYSVELEEYKSKYNQIETLKYYSSPTTGIQLLFANMYLNKILTNANNILSRLFGGQFALLPLIITESEFRIPVAVNGGINHDDITSMSSAQISLISMIISISLLSQTSTKLNIIVGDEIDAPFDSENRREFINILYQLMGLVNSSQCVLISHNSEISLKDCDVILLKSENDIISDGNIIWNYNYR